MAAIERFTALVDARTARRSDALTQRTDRLLVIQTLTLVRARPRRRGAVRARRAADRQPAPAADRGDPPDRPGRLEHARADRGRRRAHAPRPELQRDGRRRRARPGRPPRRRGRGQGRRAAPADDRRPRPRRGLPVLRRRRRRALRPLLQPRRPAHGLPPPSRATCSPTTAASGSTAWSTRPAPARAWHHEYRVHAPTAGSPGWRRTRRRRRRRRALRLRRRRHRAQGARGRPAQRARAGRGRRPREVALPGHDQPRAAHAAGGGLRHARRPLDDRLSPPSSAT